jgi:hypothetical protein
MFDRKKIRAGKLHSKTASVDGYYHASKQQRPASLDLGGSQSQKRARLLCFVWKVHGMKALFTKQNQENKQCVILQSLSLHCPCWSRAPLSLRPLRPWTTHIAFRAGRLDIPANVRTAPIKNARRRHQVEMQLAELIRASRTTSNGEATSFG